MARNVTAPGVLRKAIEVGAVPAAASVSRKGEARWEAGDLSYRAWVWKDAAGALTWDLYIGDAKFSALMSEYGGLSVPVRSSQNAMPWPMTADSLLADFLQEGLGRAGQFVIDRADLCALLSSSEDVRRGGLYAWLPIANYPARLVQALILARDIGEVALESQILSKLQGDSIRLSNGRSLDILKSAKSWASKYSTALGFDVPI